MKRLLLLVVTLATAGATAAPTSAAPSCSVVKATGHTQLNPATMAFEGTATFVIDGVEQQAESSTVVLSWSERGSASFLTTSHTFTLADGRVIRTLDNARLAPTPEDGVFRLISHLRVVEGGSGFLAGPGGTIDLRGLPTATWELSGQLCDR